MEKTCKNESLPSRDWVCLDQERFASHPQLSPRHGAQKALVITGFFWSGQVFLLLGMLGDWWSLVRWCPTTPSLSLWVSLFSLLRETCRNQQVWEGHWERAPGEIQVEAADADSMILWLVTTYFCGASPWVLSEHECWPLGYSQCSGTVHNRLRSGI